MDKLKYMIPKKTYKNKIRQKKKKNKKTKKQQQQQQQKKQHNNHIAKPPNSKISIYGNLMTLLLEFLWLPVSLRRTANNL